MDELEIGDRVEDRWFRWWGPGVVKKILRTRVYVQFSRELVKYDIPHARRFLEKVT